MISDIFQYASRNKLRFASVRGEITLENLWDAPLRSRDGFDLNAIAKSANATWKAATEENFVETTRTEAHVRLEVALDVIKHVIAAKLDDEATARRRADNKAKKEKLLAVLERKQDERLDSLSMKDIQKQIASLDEE